MQICANENIPEDCVTELRRAGHDVLWIREAAPGSSDARVLDRAISENRILITFDKDFGDLVFRERAKAPPGIILFRIAQNSSTALATKMKAIIGTRSDWSGHYCVVDEGSIRMRPLH